MLLAVPKYGRVKVNKVLSRAASRRARRSAACRERQRTELVSLPALALSPSRVFVITGPSGVGKGTLIRGLLERVPELELSVSATTREPRPGEERRRRLPLPHRRRVRPRVRAGDFVEHADYSGNRYGTLRSELERRAAAGVPVRARDRGPGRAPGARGDARGRAGLHRAAVGGRAARAPGRPRHRRRRGGRARGCHRPATSSRPRPSSPTSSSTTGSTTRSTSWSASCGQPGAAARLGPRDLAPHRQAARAGRLELRQRDRRRQARAPDQLATTTTSARARSTSSRRRWSTPRRRTTSRSRSRRSRAARSSTTTAVQAPVPWRGCLLGVSGGIAAYKALELARLATKAGPRGARRSAPRRRSRFVGRASFAGITGAPVLVDEFEPDPPRGAFPATSARPTTRRSRTSSWSANADVYLIAPASANTLAKLANGPGRQPAHHRRAGRPLPAARRAGDEQPRCTSTRPPRPTSRPLRARGVDVLEPGTGALGSRGEWGAGRLPEPPELLAAVEADARPATAEPRRACACSSPPAARASRSTRCASSATARPAAWASRSPRRPPAAAPRSPASPPTSRLPRHAGYRVRRRRDRRRARRRGA